MPPNDVKLLLQSLNSHRASGPDEIPPHLLKMCYQQLSDSIAVLVNESLRSGHFPTPLKSANVCLLYRKGKSQDGTIQLPTDFAAIYTIKTARESRSQATARPIEFVFHPSHSAVHVQAHAFMRGHTDYGVCRFDW